jgi:hypothetical protein
MSFDVRDAKLCGKCNYIFATPGKCVRCGSKDHKRMVDLIDVYKLNWKKVIIERGRTTLISEWD